MDQIIAKKKFFAKLERDKSKPFTLVLDLDETLIHTVDRDQSYDVELDIEDSQALMQVRLADLGSIQQAPLPQPVPQESCS